jgi:uroporphyrinogen decarboxylase
MRQAGRYLPEYQAVRGKHTFWEMVRTHELAVEVTIQPLSRFGMDAAILFSDILIVLDALGLDVRYETGGPVIEPLVRTEDDFRFLETKVDAAQAFPYAATAIKMLCDRLHPTTGVIGFAGAPFTLAAYLVEGGPSKSLSQLKAMAYRRPDLLREISNRLSDVVADLLRLQIDAGADVVQIFDTWAWHLSPEDYETLALPYTKRVIDRIGDRGVPIIHYLRNAAGHLETAAASGCSVVSVDTSIRLSDARRRLPPEIGLQGNLDPCRLAGSHDEIRRWVHGMIRDAKGGGYIVNLGQGLTPETPIEGVEAFVRAVQEWKE